jgi:hypothetical protein
LFVSLNYWFMIFCVSLAIGGGKPTWEAAWRAALERFQYKKSMYNGLETPTSSHLGKYA